MSVLKDTAIESIKRMPESCDVEDIMYRINFIAQVMEGLEDVKAGRTITTEELLRKVDEWGK